MDSQERHDLKQNDLVSAADGVRNFLNSPWIEKHGNKVLLVLVLLVAAVAVRMWASNRYEAMQEQVQSDLASATNPESLDAITQSGISDITIRSLALLRSGDLYLERATAGPSVLTFTGGATTQPTTTTTDPASDARNALLRYQELLELQNVSTLVRLNALLGLGAAHENLSQWDKAGQAYEQLIKEAGTDYPMITTQATNRLAILPRLKQPIRFAAETPAQAEDAAGGQPQGPAPLPGLGTLPVPNQAPQPAPVEPAATEPATP